MVFREYYEILDDENKKNVKNAIVQKLLDQIEVTNFSKYVDSEIEKRLSDGEKTNKSGLQREVRGLQILS